MDEEDLGELQPLGRAVFRTFDMLLNQRWTADESTVVPPKRSVEAERQRLQLWSQNMGLLQTGHASLDYRIRDAPIIKKSLVQTFAKMQEDLDNLSLVVFMERLPVERNEDFLRRAAEPACTTGSLVESSDACSDESSDSESFHEAVYRLESVVKQVNSLYRLAAEIRNPRFRPQRPAMDLYKHIPENERQGYKAARERIEIMRASAIHKQYLREKFTDAQLEEKGFNGENILEEYASSKHWLLSRIGLANARRAQQFQYWKAHAELLARDIAVDASVSEQVPNISTPSRMAPVAAITRKLGVLSIATSATPFDESRMLSPSDAKSVVSQNSRASTANTSRGEKIEWWPSPPSITAGDEYFCCPHCKTLCPVSYASDDEWRKHIIHDLQPYQCTYEDCPDSNRLYSQRQEWTDHENEHRRVWKCHKHHQEFITLLDYQRHIEDEHTDSSRTVTPALASMLAEASSKPWRDCPLCPTAFFDVADMRNHIRFHLERLALTIFPEEESEHSRSTSSNNTNNSNNRVVGNRGRLNSIANDFDQKEVFLFEELLASMKKTSAAPDAPKGPLSEAQILNLNTAARDDGHDTSAGVHGWLSLISEEDAEAPSQEEREFEPDQRTQSTDEGATPLGQTSSIITEANRDESNKISYGAITRLLVNPPRPDEGYSDYCSPFLPNSRVHALLQRHRVELTLRADIPSLTQSGLEKLTNYVMDKANKVFLILIRSRTVQYLELLQRHDFTDEDLPIGFDGNKVCRMFVDGKPKSLNELSLDVFSMWSEAAIETFFQHQWIFLVPTFRKAQFEYNFDRRCSLPFVDLEDDKTFQGGFGTVRRLGLQSEYTDFLTLDKTTKGAKPYIEVAVKALSFTAPAAVDVEEFYENEMRTLKLMRDLNDDHLIKAIAAYKKGRQRGFVFPWAQGGNLQEFWKRDRAQLSRGLVSWAMAQMSGISRAIGKLHRAHTRHGDIKPLNVLHFPGSGDRFSWGNLVVAGVQLAEGPRDSISPQKPGFTRRYGTSMYEPPEMIDFDLETTMFSRRYDVWCLGCVFLEFTTWLLYGQRGLDQFYQDLEASKIKRFWQQSSEGAVLHPVVGSLINHIQNDVNKNSVLWTLVELISSRLLIGIDQDHCMVGQPTKYASRATAFELVGDLERILNEGSETGSYYFDHDMETVPSNQQTLT